MTEIITLCLVILIAINSVVHAYAMRRRLRKTEMQVACLWQDYLIRHQPQQQQNNPT